MTFHQASGAKGRIELVDGRAPRPVHTQEPVRIAGSRQWARVLEVALSRTAAGLLGVAVGDRLVTSSDAGDPLVRGVALEERSPLVVKVAGLFEPRDPQAAFWQARPELDVPLVEETADKSQRFVYALGLFAPQAYVTLVDAARPMPLQYSWRYQLDPERLDAQKLPQLEEDVRRLDARYGQQLRPTETYVRTGLPAIFARFEAERDLSRTLLALVEVGLLAVALTVIAMLGALIAGRRSGTIAMARARGASALQVLTAQAAEALLLALTVGVAAYLLALLLIDGRSSSLSALSVALVVGATVVLLTVLSAGAARRTVPLERREDEVVEDVSPHRLALEAVVVLAAVIGVYLLRRRGLGSEGAEAGGINLYLAAVPVLLGLAVGLVAVRLYPLPLGATARAAAARRDLVPVLAARRVSRRRGAAAAAVLALVLAVGVAVFAAVEVRSIQRGQVQTSWERVGADLRVDAEGGALAPEVVTAADGSADAIAEAWVSEEARIPTGAGTTGGLTLLALDPQAYGAVVAGTPADVSLPEGGSPPPAVVSLESPQGARFELGRPFTVQVRDGELEVVPVARAEAIAGLPPGEPFAVVSLEDARAAFGDVVQIDRLYVRGGDPAAIEQAAPDAVVLSREDVFQSVDDSPLAAGTINGFRAGAAVGAAFAALAVALAVVLTARERARDLTTLRALGLSGRQAVGLTALEAVPPALLAIALGIGLGLGIAHLIAPGVDLAAFTGGEAVPDLTVPIVFVLLLAAGLALVLALVVLGTGTAARRADLSRVLRAEER